MNDLNGTTAANRCAIKVRLMSQHALGAAVSLFVIYITLKCEAKRKKKSSLGEAKLKGYYL